MLPRPPGQGSGAAGVRGRKQMVRMEVVKELKARIFNITQGLIAKQQKSFAETEQKPTLFFFVFPWNEEVRCEPCHQEIDVCGFASQFILRDNYASSDNFIFIFQTWNPCLLQLLREQSRTQIVHMLLLEEDKMCLHLEQRLGSFCVKGKIGTILGCTDPVSLSHDSETCDYNGKAILSNM